MADFFKKRKSSKGYEKSPNFIELRRTKFEIDTEKKKKARISLLVEQRKKIQNKEDQRVNELTLSGCFDLIHTDSVENKIKGAHDLRLILSRNYTPPLQELINSGVISVLIDFTTWFDYPELQYEAAWSLSNIASGDIDHAKVLVENGVVPKITEMLNSPHEHVQDQGVWVIGNITGDSSSYSELICAYNGVQKLISIIKNCSTDYLLKSAVWALGNLCKGEKSPEFKVIKDSVSVFCELLNKQDLDLIKESLWTLSAITEYSEESGNIVISCNVLEKIISFFNHEEINIQLPAITMTARIAAGSDFQTSAVVGAGAIPALIALINSPKREIRKEAIFCLSNIAAGTEEHIECMFKEEVFLKVIRILYRDDESVKIEALWTLANAAGKGSKKQINELVKSGVISALIHCLGNEDSMVLQVVLLGIKEVLKSGNAFLTESGSNPYAVIFEECGGVRLLDKLQFSENSKIYEEAFSVLSNFFDSVPVDQDLVDVILGNNYD